MPTGQIGARMEALGTDQFEPRLERERGSSAVRGAAQRCRESSTGK
jgi:hypothetical protein